MMIEGSPEESKHCVSYGQVKGCYWTIPATSTQGTTKESDKDYIVRVSVGAQRPDPLRRTDAPRWSLDQTALLARIAVGAGIVDVVVGGW